MNIGQAWQRELGSMDKATSFKLLDEYVSSGGNFIDTANDYQDEESEAWLGEYFETRGIRDQMVIATKYTTHYRKHDLGLAGINYAGNHRKALRLSVEASLQKLRTSYIDILYLHWWDHTTSIEEIMDSLHVLVEQGKILYLGMSVSGPTIPPLRGERDVFLRYQSAKGLMPFNRIPQHGLLAPPTTTHAPVARPPSVFTKVGGTS